MKSRTRIPRVHTPAFATTDPRVENIVSVFKGWRDARDSRNRSEQVQAFMKQLLECVDFAKFSLDEIRCVVEALATNDTLDAMNKEANDERVLQLQSAHGGDIAAALSKTGIGAFDAERLAHEAIATAVLLTTKKAEGDRDAG